MPLDAPSLAKFSLSACPPSHSPVLRGFYASQLPFFMRRFPAENMNVFIMVSVQWAEKVFHLLSYLVWKCSCFSLYHYNLFCCWFRLIQIIYFSFFSPPLHRRTTSSARITTNSSPALPPGCRFPHLPRASSPTRSRLDTSL